MSSDEHEQVSDDALPDPTLRHWRHPSELGALNGPTPTATAMRHSGLLPLVFIGTFAVGGVGAMLVALSISGAALFSQSGLAVNESDLAAFSSPGSSPNGTGTVTSTTLLAPPVPAEDTPAIESFATGEPTLPEDGGVFAGPLSERRLASYLVHDGMIMTSAGALDGRRGVWLTRDHIRVRAEVIGIDPYTDVAVLGVDQWPATVAVTDLAGLALADPEHGDRVSIPPAGVEKPAADATSPGVDRPTPEMASSSSSDDGGEAIPSWEGVVGSTDGPVTTALHRLSYDAFVTSMSDPVPPGSVVVTEDGELAGMVIAANTKLVAAIPMTTALAVASSLMTSGAPTETWLGVEVSTDAEGSARLVSVAENGPADGLLQPGDVIESVDGEALLDSDHLVHLVRTAGAAAELDLVVQRDGAELTVHVRTGRRPPNPAD